MKRQILSLIVVAVGLSACQGGGGSPSTPKDKPLMKEAQGIEFALIKESDKFSFKDEHDGFVSNLNKYSVSVRIPPTLIHDIRIFKVDAKGNEQEVDYEQGKFVNGKSQYIEKYELSSGEYENQKVTYRVVSDAGQLLAEKQFNLLPDLYVTGTKSAKEIGLKLGVSNFANVVLDHAIVQTDGFTYNLTAEKFFSQESLLTSYGEKPVAARGMAGRAGGFFEVITRYAEGNLALQFNGESGGEGYSDFNSAHGYPGGNGGNSGYLYLTYEEGEIEVVDYSTIGQGGVGGEGNLKRGQDGLDGKFEKSCVSKDKNYCYGLKN